MICSFGNQSSAILRYFCCLFYTSVGSLEKVHVVNGRTVDVDMGQGTAYVYMAGKRYRLRGDVLTEED